jgi:hypothetical protein
MHYARMLCTTLGESSGTQRKEKEQLRKLKLLAALLAMMTVIALSTASPAMAYHWDYYDDPLGECGWVPIWVWSDVFEEWTFEGYAYYCHF